MRVAIIDLGSNTFHMIIVDVNKDYTFRLIDRYSHLTRLGAYMSTSKSLPQDVLHKSINLVGRYCTRARKYKVEHIAIFATGVFRHLSNTRLFVNGVKKKTGVRVAVLSEKEEATIVFTAIDVAYPKLKKYVVMDIGGGSSEFIFVQNKKFSWFKSIPLGTANITAKILCAKTEQDRHVAEKVIFERYKRGVSFLKTKKVSRAFMTSGLGRYLSGALYRDSLCEPKEPSPTQSHLTRQDVQKIVRCFAAGETLNFPADRKDLIVTGATVLLKLMETIPLKEILIPQVSCREGYLFKLIKEGVIQFDA
jgi:exopolyphosphatase / guanosine-5'-triphosphate,3'-diphosphate pyrophosphatase